MAGRKTSRTPENAKALTDYLAGGATVKDACALVGISQETFFSWCKADAEFSDATTRARSQGRMQAVLVIRNGIKSGNTEDAKWFLERTDPENWGKRTYAKVDFDLSQVQELVKALRAIGEDEQTVFNRLIETARKKQLADGTH